MSVAAGVAALNMWGAIGGTVIHTIHYKPAKIERYIFDSCDRQFLFVEELRADY
jgi:hypothetical protein